MRNILQKEIKLSASVLTFLFIAFGLMFLIPNYPILCGVFFTTLGIFQSFQSARESNDIVFSALLPIKKSDVVKGKYLFVCFIEACSFLLMAFSTIMRMTVLSNAEVYRNTTLMNANLFALGTAFLIFGIFNAIFVGGFFKTAYKLGKPFVIYIIVCFVTIGFAEAVHYFPGLEKFNALGFDYLCLQVVSLLAGIALFALLTFFSYKKSCRNFDRIDL